MTSKYKKVLLIICIGMVVLLTSCNSKMAQDNISYYEPDMSEYVRLEDSDCFKGITIDELLEIFKENKSAIIYMGYSQCGNCQQAVPIMADIAKEKGVSIYYLDFYNEKYPIEDDAIVELEIILDEYLMIDPSDEVKKIFTPHLFSIKDGKVIKSQVGTLEESELKEIYEEIIG